MQSIDHAACRDYFNQNYGCAVCLAKCPFSEIGYEKVKDAFQRQPQSAAVPHPCAAGACAGADQRIRLEGIRLSAAAMSSAIIWRLLFSMKKLGPACR